jgi:protocatechuate 3,4-dioxygenase beta subunit
MTLMVRLMMSPDEVVARTESEADGSYELLVPKGGAYSVRTRAPGFSQEVEAPRAYTSDVEGLDFYLFPGVQLSGRVVDGDGAGVAGAAVMLVDPMAVFARQEPKLETVTAADGAFAVSATPAGNMLLVVRASGFATHMESDLTLPALDMRITLEQGVSVRLRAVDAAQKAIPAPDVSVAIMYKGGFAAGETNENGDLLLENLPVRGSRAWGSQQMAILWGGAFVTHMVQLGSKEPVDGMLDIGTVELVRGGVITGTVTNKETGDPVAGARLRSMGGLSPQLEFMGAVTTLSEKDGTFKLRGVPKKAHTLMATHPDYVSDIDPMAMMQAMQGSGGKPLFAANADTAEKNVELTPAATLMGTVLGPDGSPAAGAKVEIRDPMGMFRQMLGGGMPSAVTDAEGKFTMGGLKRGKSILLTATHREFGRSESANARPGEPITLNLTEPLLIEGVIVDEDDAPVSGVRVTVERVKDASNTGNMMMGPNQETGAARPAVTDTEGRFLVRNAPPGQLNVQIEHASYEPSAMKINIAPGTSTHDLGKTILKRGHGIKGVVVDGAGKPIARTTIYAQWDYQGGTQPPQGTGRIHGNVTCDETGKFAIYGLRPGKYRLRTWHQEFYSSNPVFETGNTEARVVLKKAGKLSGRVMAGGKPVSNANVNAVIITPKAGEQGDDSNHVAFARTDLDGVFQLNSLPPDEPFQLQIRHDGYQSLDVDGVRVSDQRTESAGDPLPSVRLSVQINGQHKRQVTSGIDGRFEAGGLDAGEITLRPAAWNQNYINPGPITVDAGDMNIRIVLEEGESITGTVYNADGTPANQVQIAALDAEGNEVSQTWSWQGDGTFTVGGLPKGTYTLKVSRWVSSDPGGLEEAESRLVVLAEVDGVKSGSTGVELKAER